MNATDLTADFASHHIEGLANQAVMNGTRADFKVPLITEIAENLWMGGVRDGVELPADLGIHHVFALYQGARYKLAHNVDRTDVVMLDGDQVPDGLTRLARVISTQRKKGPVLVHCQAGLNRSSLVTALTLILDQDVDTAQEAIDLIRRKRHEVCLCNPAFENWLLEWDQQPIEPTPEELEDAENNHGQGYSIEALLSAIEHQADGIDRDRRESDKVLCGTARIREEIRRFRTLNGGDNA